MAFCLTSLICILTGCDEANAGQPAENVYVPGLVNYADSGMWHVELNDKGDGADMFYTHKEIFAIFAKLRIDESAHNSEVILYRLYR